MINNGLPKELTELLECAAPATTASPVVVQDGPHRLVGTSPCPTVPYRVDRVSYEAPLDPSFSGIRR
jgi:hypothetical protein